MSADREPDGADLRDAMRDTARRLGFVYTGAAGFADAAHRAAERTALLAVYEAVGTLRDAVADAGAVEAVLAEARRRAAGQQRNTTTKPSGHSQSNK